MTDKRVGPVPSNWWECPRCGFWVPGPQTAPVCGRCAGLQVGDRVRRLRRNRAPFGNEFGYHDQTGRIVVIDARGARIEWDTPRAGQDQPSRGCELRFLALVTAVKGEEESEKRTHEAPFCAACYGFPRSHVCGKEQR